MKRATARAIGLMTALLASAAACAPPVVVPAHSGSRALHLQLHRTQDEMRRQQAQADQLRARVNALEHSSAADRVQLDRRDREIAELQRKLAALPAASTPASADSH